MEADHPSPREAVLIVNAHSRRGRELFREAKEKIEQAGIKLLKAHALRNPSKLHDTVRKAVLDGAPMIIVGGGDGSLSCAVDDLVDRDCVFALLPLGTANSFARTLGIPLDLDGAIDTIANGRRRRIDLGKVNGDYYANCSAMGLSPQIGEGIPPKLKKYLGRFGYLIWAIYCLIKFKPFKLTIDDGKDKKTMDALEVLIANGRFHGGVEIVEEAGVESGDIVVQAITGRKVSRLVWNWLASMLHLPTRHLSVETFRGARLTITTDPPLPISIDGEVLARTPAIAEVARCAIEVMVPVEEEQA